MEHIDIEGITPVYGQGRSEEIVGKALQRRGLDEDAMQAIESIVAEHVTDPVGPEFMAPPSRDDRKWDLLERLIA